MTETRPRRASLADVAKLAGVSAQTVSRVVRQSGVVAQDTRSRVMAAVKELNYQPNLAARSLSQNRTGVVHVLNATPLFHGHASVFLEIVRALGEQGYQSSTSLIPEGPSSSFSQLVPIGVDGVVLLGGHSRSAEWAEAFHTEVPVVFVGQRTSLPTSVASVEVDQRHGAFLATNHLLAEGRRNLLHICGPRDWLDAQERRDGFLEACRAGGAHVMKLSSPAWDAIQGYRLGPDIPDSVDGIFASNDQLALGVMRQLLERGRRIPEDVAVVGFDDSAGSDCFWPPLSTVRQPFQAVGRTAVAHLQQLIAGGEPQHTTIQPELIVRGSTKGT